MSMKKAAWLFVISLGVVLCGCTKNEQYGKIQVSGIPLPTGQNLISFSVEARNTQVVGEENCSSDVDNTVSPPLKKISKSKPVAAATTTDKNKSKRNPLKEALAMLFSGVLLFGATKTKTLITGDDHV